VRRHVADRSRRRSTLWNTTSPIGTHLAVDLAANVIVVDLAPHVFERLVLDRTGC
jgi:hypothetical protein